MSNFLLFMLDKENALIYIHRVLFEFYCKTLLPSSSVGRAIGC
jgi:hypothetical protein